jgi:hypothetical protein
MYDPDHVFSGLFIANVQPDYSKLLEVDTLKIALG